MKDSISDFYGTMPSSISGVHTLHEGLHMQ